MSIGQGRSPLILLMDESRKTDGAEVRNWLKATNISVCEVSNIFEALGEISDFTIRSRPDVLLLDIDTDTAALPSVREMIKEDPTMRKLPLMDLTKGLNVQTDASHKARRHFTSRLSHLFESKLN